MYVVYNALYAALKCAFEYVCSKLCVLYYNIIHNCLPWYVCRFRISTFLLYHLYCCVSFTFLHINYICFVHCYEQLLHTVGTTMKVLAVTLLFLSVAYASDCQCKSYPCLLLKYDNGTCTEVKHNSSLDIDLVANAGGLICKTDLISCCSRKEGHFRGNWFSPNDVRLPFKGHIHQKRMCESVNLYYSDIEDLDVSGEYSCKIPTVAQHDPYEIISVHLYHKTEGAVQ